MTTVERAENGPVRRTMAVTAVSMPSDRLSGFHTLWLDGGGGPVTFDLSVGAGLGNANLTLTVKVAGEPVAIETVDIRDLAQEWVRSVAADYEAGDLISWRDQPRADDFPEGWR